jgi:hypothetical protein
MDIPRTIGEWDSRWEPRHEDLANVPGVEIRAPTTARIPALSAIISCMLLAQDFHQRQPFAMLFSAIYVDKNTLTGRLTHETRDRHWRNLFSV